MEQVRASVSLVVLFVMVVVLNISLWFHVRDLRGEWTNVPPVPSRAGALVSAFGDPQFAYRTIGIMLQNLGDTGGRMTPLKSYNYADLAGWLRLESDLDPRSSFAPSLAGYYFSSVDDPARQALMVDYLEAVGSRPGQGNWRWLALAVNIARFQVQDLDRALELARKLAGLDDPALPAWARQMPAFVQEARGDRQDAVSVMIEMLRSEGDRLPVQEVNYMRDYICNRVLDAAESAVHPLCQDPIP